MSKQPYCITYFIWKKYSMIIEVFGCLFYCATIPRNPLITLENNTKNKASIYSTKGLPFLFLLPTKWKPWTLAAFVVSWAPHKKPSNKIFCSFRCTFPWQERNVLLLGHGYIIKKMVFASFFSNAFFRKTKPIQKGRTHMYESWKEEEKKTNFPLSPNIHLFMREARLSFYRRMYY